MCSFRMKEILVFALLVMSATVPTTNLTLEDFGTCVDENGNFEQNIPFQKGGEPPLAVKEHKGGNISIECKYPKEFKESTKRFCRRHETSKLYHTRDLKTLQYRLHDNENENTFTVAIHNLKKWDSGIYWCEVRTDGNNETFIRQVNLQITAYIAVKAFAGGGIVIHCKMHHDHQYKEKYFCKGNATACLTHKTDSRFTRIEGIIWEHLSFVFDNLTSDDNGTYYCVADGELHTEYQLHVGDGHCFEQLSVTENEGGNAIIQCKYPREFINSSKIFCKEHEGCKKLNSTQKYSLADDRNENVFHVTIYNMERKDAGNYWCGVKPGKYYAILLSEVALNISETDIKTPVLVVTVVLLLAVIIFLCWRDRQSRKHGRSSKVIYYTAENPDPDRIYEEIEDIGLPPAPVTSSTCTVATADKTDIPNYCTIQSTLNFPDETRQHLLFKGTHSSVITTVYTTAQLPTVTTPFSTIPGDVPTYSNIQPLTNTSTNYCLKTGGDETESSLNSVYVNAQEPVCPNDGPTTYTDQPEDPTNSVNQDPTNTNEDTV